jgi:putative oxidoreductase
MKTNLSMLYPIGRALLGTLFLISGLLKIPAFAGVSGWMAAAGLPFADLLLVLTIALEVGGGAMLILGLQARWAALAIALFLVPTTLIFHAFWGADAANFQNELTSFLKNLAILGGMLLVFQRESSTR